MALSRELQLIRKLEQLTNDLSPYVVYKALRHYCKQGLFETPEEMEELERAINAIVEIGEDV